VPPQLIVIVVVALKPVPLAVTVADWLPVAGAVNTARALPVLSVVTLEVTVPRVAEKLTATLGTAVPLASLTVAVTKVELLQPSELDVAARVAWVGVPTVEVAVAVGTTVPVVVAVAVGVVDVAVAVGVVVQVTVNMTVVVAPLVTATPVMASEPLGVPVVVDVGVPDDWHCEAAAPVMSRLMA
jgi:hypothetical protein